MPSQALVGNGSPTSQAICNKRPGNLSTTAREAKDQQKPSPATILHGDKLQSGYFSSSLPQQTNPLESGDRSMSPPRMQRRGTHGTTIRDAAQKAKQLVTNDVPRRRLFRLPFVGLQLKIVMVTFRATLTTCWHTRVRRRLDHLRGFS